MEIKETQSNKWIFYLIIIALTALVLFLVFNNTNLLSKSADKNIDKAKKHSDSSKIYFERYKGRFVKDSALELKYDSLESVKQKIKIETNEKIKMVDKYSVSDMQYYFDERTRN